MMKWKGEGGRRAALMCVTLSDRVVLARSFDAGRFSALGLRLDIDNTSHLLRLTP